jgi:Bacterial Ig-like domain (group 2)
VLLAVFFLSASLSARSQTSTYYVAPNGSDGNNGSQGFPFATIERADSLAAPGDTVIVMDGTYTGDITLTANGTSRSPITYKAQNKWRAKLLGTGTGDGSAVIRVSGAHTVIQDFDITGSNANGIILAYTGTTASYNQAIGNYVHDIVIPCDSNGGTAIETGGGDNYSGITHNDMIGNLVVNITQVQPCSGAPASSGLYAQIPYSVIANNIVINVGYAIQAWHAASNITVFGNTLINDYRPITIGDGDAPGNVVDDYSLVQNNIIVNAGSTAIAETTGGTSTTGTHNQYIDNLVYGGNTTISLNNGLQPIGTVYADPKFVSAATGDYHLQAGSPAIGAGLALAGVLTDFAGTPRPQSGPTDIGAYLSLPTNNSNIVLQSIVVSGSNSVAVGSAVQLTATGEYSDGSQQDLTSSVTWTSSSSVASVTSGLVTGNQAGSATITASLNGVSGSESITVRRRHSHR